MQCGARAWTALGPCRGTLHGIECPTGLEMFCGYAKIGMRVVAGMKIIINIVTRQMGAIIEQAICFMRMLVGVLPDVCLKKLHGFSYV